MSKNGDRTSLLEGDVNKHYLIKFETKFVFSYWPQYMPVNNIK